MRRNELDSAMRREALLLERLLEEHLDPVERRGQMRACPFSGGPCSLRECMSAHACDLDRMLNSQLSMAVAG